MKNFFTTLTLLIMTAANSFADDWGKADIGAFDDSLNFGSSLSDSCVYTISGIVGGLMILLLIISKIADYVDKDKK